MIRREDVVVDLDETMWDWCAPFVGQPVWRGAHREWITLREPLVELLGMLPGGPLPAWTAGYGYRIDQVCAARPALGALLELNRGDRAEDHPTIMTRLGFARALERDPTVVDRASGDRLHWVSEKIPGMPTLADRPLVDAARILLDDRETNCRRFVAAGDGRSALWLRGTPRVWKDNLPLRRPHPAPTVEWASGVAAAFARIEAGETGLFPITPRRCARVREPLRVVMPWNRIYREWIEPARRVSRLLRPAS